MPRNPTIEFDQLQLYMGYPYVIDLENAVGSITVYSPTIGDMVQIGYKKFYETLNIFICNTTSWRLPLWEMGIDWNEYSDFQLFITLLGQADEDVCKLFFGENINIHNFEPFMKIVGKDEEGNDMTELSLLDKENMIEINNDVYNHISQYLRNVFNTFPEEKITKDNTLKDWYIRKDKRALEERQRKIKEGKEEKETSIQPLISACVNHPGFKYKLSELKEVGVAEFFDSVQRLQIYEQATALMKGMYSGFIDGKSIKPENYNFMRET